MKRALSLILLLSLVFVFSGCGHKEEKKAEAPAESSKVVKQESGKFVVANLAQIDAFPIFNALKTGAVEKYGFKNFTDKNLLTFDSGMEVVEGAPADAFSIGNVGMLPALLSSLRNDSQIIGIASDESDANAIIARANNPIFGHQNAKYPHAFGVAADVKGKVILTTSISSSHQTLSKWLGSMGLTDKDVTIKTIEQQTAIKAFESGEGDYLVLWAPNLYKAYDKGFKQVATAKDVDSASIMLYVAPKKWINSHPEQASNFLAMVNQQVVAYNEKGVAMAPEISKFFKDYGGLTITEKEAVQEIQRHKLYTIDEQIQLIESGQLEEWLKEAAVSFQQQEKIKPDEVKTLVAKKFNVTEKYLKAAKDIKAN